MTEPSTWTLSFQELLSVGVAIDACDQRTSPFPQEQLTIFVDGASSTAHDQLPSDDHHVSAPWAGIASSRAPVAVSRSSASPRESTASSTRSQPHTVRPSPRESVVYVPKKRVRYKTIRRREQCRVNQARYRQKQAAKHSALRASVEDLHSEIQELAERRFGLCDRVAETKRSPRQTLFMLFDLLRCGLSDATNTSSIPSRSQQLEFLTLVIHEHVQVGDSCGRPALLDQLTRFTTFFGDLRRTICYVQYAAGDDTSTTLHTKIRLELTITFDTIRHVFPHLVLPANHALRQKLLGQRLVCDVHDVTGFDAVDCIVDVDWKIDFVGALGRFLSIQETAYVLNNARIERDAFLMAPMPRCRPEPKGAAQGSADWSHGRHRYLPGQRFARLAIAP